MIWSIFMYVVVLLLLGGYALFSLRIDGWRRIVAPLLFVVVIGLSFIGYTQSLGYPIPVWALPAKQEMQVIAVFINEPKAIYVWGYMEGKVEPVVVTLPFTKEKAMEAQGSQETAAEAGAPAVMGWSDGEYGFHVPPVEPMPPKTY